MLTHSTEDGGGVHVGPGTAVSSLAVAGCLLHGCGDLVFFGTTSILASTVWRDGRKKNSGGRVDSLVEVEAGLNVRQKFEINRDKSSCPKTGPGNIGPG